MQYVNGTYCTIKNKIQQHLLHKTQAMLQIPWGHLNLKAVLHCQREKSTGYKVKQ